MGHKRLFEQEFLISSSFQVSVTQCWHNNFSGYQSQKVNKHDSEEDWRKHEFIHNRNSASFFGIPNNWRNWGLENDTSQPTHQKNAISSIAGGHFKKILVSKMMCAIHTSCTQIIRINIANAAFKCTSEQKGSNNKTYCFNQMYAWYISPVAFSRSSATVSRKNPRLRRIQAGVFSSSGPHLCNW